ncbi:MAG: host attachment protein [Deltaproteobacteria bacterium]|nr:host attachment protein [Deltaproteobacteria bacterium]
MSMDWKGLRELLETEDRSEPVVSLYLNLADPGRIETELNSLVRTAHKQLDKDERFEGNRRRKLDRLLSDMHRRLRSEIGPETSARLLVVFADTDGLWREYRLPVALPSRMVIRQDPYTRPLGLLLDEFPRYAVLVADARKARLFSLYLGDLEEHPDVLIRDEVPDRVRAKKSMAVSAWGVYSGVGDQRIQRHIEDHMHRHFRHVAERAFSWFKAERFNRMIVAAPDERTLSRLKDHLHSYLSRRVRGEFTARPDDDRQELKEKAIERTREIERREERELLDRLIDHHLSGGLGAVGLQPVLDALLMGQVHTLVMKDDFETSGYVCPEDRYLSAGAASCPSCGQPLQPVDRFADEIVQEALNQGAEIQHVTIENEGFDPHGIGALLRFRV